ncbi:eg45-like domain containing protein [Quercus suber]|uniref:Eg45-like domain containing protein n=1 Tax=Quercus suber TaxID=58331 RepID=A0AAW0KSU4_QUESU
MNKWVLIMVAMAVYKVSILHALKETASFYNDTYACQRYPTDMDLIGAVGEALWENGVACGRLYDISCIGATNAAPHPYVTSDHTVVAIVEAFSGIADPAAGRIKIEYTQYA